MDLFDAVKQGFSRFADFNGRAPRPEFWLWKVFFIPTALLLNIVPVIGQLAVLALLVPNTAVTIRRLHDTNRTGWWLVLPYVPAVAIAIAIIGIGVDPDNPALEPPLAVAGGVGIAGFIMLLVYYCLPGTPDENRFGPPSGVNEA